MKTKRQEFETNPEKFMLKCGVCGKTFLPTTYSQYKNLMTKSRKYNRPFYCSKGCSNHKRVKNTCECEHCGKQFKITKFALEHSKRHFCSRECYHRHEEENRIHKQNTACVHCLNCGKQLEKNKSKFCSPKCQHEYLFKQKVKMVDKDKSFVSQTTTLYGIKEVNRKFVRKYLEYKHGHKCAICGNTHWLGQPILLIVDHIDGDIDNYNVDNYRLICSNCDATLPTYKSKNRQKGKRKYRRVDKILIK